MSNGTSSFGRKTVQMRALPRFPADIQAGAGLVREQSGLTYTFRFGFESLIEVTPTDFMTAYVPVWDEADNLYTRTSLQTLVNAVAGGATDEQIDDRVAALLAAGTHSGITFDYDDAGNALSATVTSGVTDEQIDDRVAALLAAGTHTGITFAYDDPGNALSATVTVEGGGGGGGGGGDPTVFDTRTEAIATTIPAGVQYIMTGGYAAVGDLGEGRYIRVGSEPAHAGKFQSADGGWWALETDYARPNQFGGTDRAAIAAADAYIVARGRGRVELRSALYTVASDLTIASLCLFRPGAKIQPADNVTIHLTNGYSAGVNQHVFDISLTGRVTGDAPSDQGHVSVRHFGAQAVPYTTATGTGYDSAPAFQAAIVYGTIANNADTQAASFDVIVPPSIPPAGSSSLNGFYRFGTCVYINRTLRIMAQGVRQRGFSTAGSGLGIGNAVVVKGDTGLRQIFYGGGGSNMEFYDAPAAHGWPLGVFGGNRAQVHGIALAPIEEYGVEYGIVSNQVMHFFHCYASDFSVAGFFAHGQTSGTNPYCDPWGIDDPFGRFLEGASSGGGSSNGTSYRECYSRLNGKHGFIASGNNAGIVLYDACDAGDNSGAGFMDNSSQVGCYYNYCHTAQNTWKVWHDAVAGDSATLITPANAPSLRSVLANDDTLPQSAALVPGQKYRLKMVLTAASSFAPKFTGGTEVVGSAVSVGGTRTWDLTAVAGNDAVGFNGTGTIQANSLVMYPIGASAELASGAAPQSLALIPSGAYHIVVGVTDPTAFEPVLVGAELASGTAPQPISLTSGRRYLVKITVNNPSSFLPKFTGGAAEALGSPAKTVAGSLTYGWLITAKSGNDAIAFNGTGTISALSVKPCSEDTGELGSQTGTGAHTYDFIIGNASAFTTTGIDYAGSYTSTNSLSVKQGHGYIAVKGQLAADVIPGVSPDWRTYWYEIASTAPDAYWSEMEGEFVWPAGGVHVTEGVSNTVVHGHYTEGGIEEGIVVRGGTTVTGGVAGSTPRIVVHPEMGSPGHYAAATAVSPKGWKGRVSTDHMIEFGSSLGPSSSSEIFYAFGTSRDDDLNTYAAVQLLWDANRWSYALQRQDTDLSYFELTGAGFKPTGSEYSGPGHIVFRDGLILADDYDAAYAKVGARNGAPGAGATVVRGEFWFNTQPSTGGAIGWRCTTSGTVGSGGVIETVTAGGGATTLDGLTDVVITSAASGEVLRHNGTNWVDATLAIADTSGLQAALDAKSPLASPTFTGTPAAPTASSGTSSTQIATTAFVADAVAKQPEVLMVAVSDETTALTTGTAKTTFRMPFAMTLTAIRGSLATAQSSGSIFTVDVNEGGTTVLSTKLTIDNGEKTSTTAAAAPVISDSALADDAEITIDIDQIGDGTAKGLKVTLIGTRT